MKSLFVRLGIVAGLGVVTVVVGGASLTLGCLGTAEESAVVAARVAETAEEGAVAGTAGAAETTGVALALRTEEAAGGVIPEVLTTRYTGLDTVRTNGPGAELIGGAANEIIRLRRLTAEQSAQITTQTGGLDALHRQYVELAEARNQLARLAVAGIGVTGVAAGTAGYSYARYRSEMQLNECKAAVDAWTAALESSDGGNPVELAKRASKVCAEK